MYQMIYRKQIDLCPNIVREQRESVQFYTRKFHMDL